MKIDYDLLNEISYWNNLHKWCRDAVELTEVYPPYWTLKEIIDSLEDKISQQTKIIAGKEETSDKQCFEPDSVEKLKEIVKLTKTDYENRL